METWTKWLVLGALSLAFGAVVLAHPFAASIAITTLAGILFLISGVFQTVIGFQGTGSGSKLLGTLLGLLMVFLGVSLTVNPLQGVLSLALLVTIIFASGGILRLVLAFRMKDGAYYWPMLISGALSVLLAGYIVANFFEVAPQLLGILLGIELLFNGAGLIVLALVIRKAGTP